MVVVDVEVVSVVVVVLVIALVECDGMHASHSTGQASRNSAKIDKVHIG